MLHLAGDELVDRLWTTAFREALAEIGEVTVVEHAHEMPEAERAARIRQYPVLLTNWAVPAVPTSLANKPGALRYVCNLTGELSQWVPLEIVEAGIAVTNWGDCPAIGVAEGAMTLLLATLKDMHMRVMNIRRNGWQMDSATTGGSLYRANIGVYGCGVIGRRFIELLRPFGAVIRVFDPFATEIPEGCERVDSLEALFGASQIVSIHAGLTDETRGSVTGELLALLPDGGVLINTARGAIVDEDALFAELRSGRLRAGLDVLDLVEPHALPDDHEARTWENCIITAHSISRGWPDNPDVLQPMHVVCLDNLRRFKRGEPLRFTYDRDRWLRST